MDRVLRFAMSHNYVLYYGSKEEQALSCFDVAILEPSGHTNETIQQIKAAGTLVIAYLSMLEVTPNSPERELLKPEDYIRIQGQAFIHQQYGNYWADLRSGTWSNILLHKISHLLSYRQYDGIFFDTLGYIEESGFPPDLKQETISAVSQIMNRIRRIFPNHILIQNGGLTEILRATLPFLNGVCWENPILGNREYGHWNSVLIRNLKKINSEYNIKILVLVENGNEHISEIRKITKENGFNLYHASKGYTGVVNTSILTDSLKREVVSRCSR